VGVASKHADVLNSVGIWFCVFIPELYHSNIDSLLGI